MKYPESLLVNTLYFEVSGAGLPEVDGLYVPSTAPPVKSESGVLSRVGYWNGKHAWDRADGKGSRSPAISYSNSYKCWRIARLDGHLAYEIAGDDELPPMNRPWNVYKHGAAPAPKLTLHYCDPRKPCTPPTVVFILGGPGAGKGTVCELAQLQLGWTHLSTGQLLRAEQKAGGPTSAIIESMIEAGKLVPNDIVVRLLKDAMERTTRSTGKTNFLLDGFPRSLSNLEAWYDVFGRETALPRMICLECSFEVLAERILKRGKFSGRSDDNVDSMKLRFETFKEETLPTVDLFKSKGICDVIDTGQSRKAVYDSLREKLRQYTDPRWMDEPLTERSEVLLGLKPFPQKGR